MSRPNWDEYFMLTVDTIGLRATCDRGKSGCVITKNNRILVTGYVGAPSGFPDCSEVGHLLETVVHQDGTKSEHCHRTIHAEMNAILQAAHIGVSLKGGTLYCTMTPCMRCAMSIVQVGIARVVCKQKYHQGAASEDVFKQAGIEVTFLNESVVVYPK
ncbi:MAG: cytidine/deoxycytidylate deaminase family protein [Candidatus Nanoarchaeia archaeon]|jgi:dCMP deaminase|nr:cytidine/deoxycytidylate deaminase family protein [Candidatus Nanoarchaeia archaeon]